MDGLLNDVTLNLLQRSMSVSLQRQNVLGANVANVDTPNYIPRDIDFARALDEVRESGEVDLQAGASISERPDRQPGLDGNAVDLDVQMARIAQNAILYDASTRATSKKLALMRYVVSEGGF